MATALPSLQQLRFLSALVEHRHFGRAAVACAVTQSTLSGGIKELEERLGAALIERSRRRVMPTALGIEIAERARRLLSDAESLVGAAQGGHEPLAGALRLGVIPTIGPYLLPPLMPALAAAFPKLKLYLREEQTAALLDKLESGLLDLVLLALPYEVGTAETMALFEDPILAALPKGHLLARTPQVDPAALAGEALLLMEDGHCLRSHALQACRIAGPVPNETVQGTSLSTLVQMAAAGLGATLIPQMALTSELPADGRLVVRPLAPAGAARTIALVWRRISASKAEFRLLGDWIRARAKRPSAAAAPRRRRPRSGAVVAAGIKESDAAEPGWR
jgi:LysR family hydrogen peroxide-inducible transcriptional activator